MVDDKRKKKLARLQECRKKLLVAKKNKANLEAELISVQKKRDVGKFVALGKLLVKEGVVGINEDGELDIVRLRNLIRAGMVLEKVGVLEKFNAIKLHMLLAANKDSIV